MLNLVNSPNMTDEQRRNTLQRAINTEPFFNLLEFESFDTTVARRVYGAKGTLDKDYWLTEIKCNFAQLTTVDNLLSAYIAGTGKSLYQYIQTERVPFQFITSGVSLESAIGALNHKQREYMPFPIKRGNSVIANLGYTVGLGPGTVLPQVVLCGYYPNPKAYVPQRTTQAISESLARPIEYDEWRFDVDFTGRKVRTITNNRTARLILGFKRVQSAAASLGTWLITDAYRDIKFNNVPIDILFFTPTIGNSNATQDVGIFYLPVEYFWEPFAPLKFEVVNDLNGGAGYEFVMLTRTV